MITQKFRKKLKKHFDDVLAIKKTPHEIALGFAIGTAIAVLPTFGLGILIGLLIILILKDVSKLAMFVAFAFWNPILLIPLAGLSYALGDFLLKGDPIIHFRIELLNQIFIYTRRFLVGNIIITIVLTILSYYIVYFLVRKYQKKEIPILQKPILENFFN